MGKLSVSIGRWLVVKQIWNDMRKYETDMKIANVHVGTIHWRWEYETDLKIAFAQFHILTFLFIVPTWTISIFILDAAGMKIHLAGIKTLSQRKNGLRNSYVDVCNFQYGDSGNENLFRRKNFRLDATWITKTQRELSPKPSTIQM